MEHRIKLFLSFHSKYLSLKKNHRKSCHISQNSTVYNCCPMHYFFFLSINVIIVATDKADSAATIM